MTISHQSKLFKFLSVGLLLALGLGAGLLHYRIILPEWGVLLLTGGVLAVSAALSRMPPLFRTVTANPEDKANSGPVWVPEAPSNTIPRYNSRRWARALYHSNVITIEELSTFYDRHPLDERDPDR